MAFNLLTSHSPQFRDLTCSWVWLGDSQSLPPLHLQEKRIRIGPVELLRDSSRFADLAHLHKPGSFQRQHLKQEAVKRIFI